ncbi:MAG: hemerythrin domain-containing protein [Bryobacterales bacterium]|nr:hemerythrin domain-containing protein [Bryobacterales bacterium]
MPVQIGQAEAGCEDPVGLLIACHRRIERFLKTLAMAGKLGAERDLEKQEFEAVARALVYFRSAAPKHTADEEEDLFPALRSKEPEVTSKVDGLLSDHARANVLHDRVDVLGQQWLRDERLAPEELKEFRDAIAQLEELYTAHIKIEESEVFPRATRLLEEDELEVMGRNMAARRGVKYVSKKDKERAASLI